MGLRVDQETFELEEANKSVCCSEKGNKSSTLLDAFISRIDRTTLNHMQKSKAMRSRNKNQILCREVIIRDGLVIVKYTDLFVGME